MYVKQFWQSLALNFTSGSPNFAPIPAVMVTASEAADNCHSYKTQKSSYAHFKNEYGSSLENTDWFFFNPSFLIYTITFLAPKQRKEKISH